MQRIDVVKTATGWEARSEHGYLVVYGPTKVDVVMLTAEWAKAQAEPISVRIHLVNGRIQEERTYPRSADPRSSEG